MSKQSSAAGGRDTLPFIAPCRKLSLFAPFRWIRLGVADLVQAPQQSMVYGLAVAVLIGAVSFVAWFRGSQWIMFGMLGGFVFLAPLVCVGLYAISAQLERGQEPVLARSLRAAFRRHIGNEAVFALVLLVIFLVWSRAAVIVTAVMYPTDGNPTTAELVSFLAFGSGVGAIFAAVTFSASAFALPMIMHRDVDSVTAIVTAVNAVLRNKGAMIVWLALIIVGLALGVVTAYVGLIVIIPVIGYATWHGYEETIDASVFPRHHEGVTATRRTNSSAAMEHDPVI